MAATVRALRLLGVALAAGAWAAAGAHAWPDPTDFDYEDEVGICFRRKSLHEDPVPVCCEGWVQVKGAATEDYDVPMCRAVCKPACINATCTAPNECKCLPNFSRKQGTPMHVCSPRCSQPCVNAVCVGPDMCRCKEGFEQSSSKNVCQKSRNATDDWGDVLGPAPPGGWSKCYPPCGPFKKCVGPNNCTCDEGFSPDPRQPDNCLPACKPPCGSHAICLANNACHCISGYKEDGKGVCVPACDDGCMNGQCVAPGECKCNEGYEKFRQGNDVLCVPQCKPPCGDFGDCIATNICNCEYNYVLSPEGDCIADCLNGTTWNRRLKICIPDTWPSSWPNTRPSPNPTAPTQRPPLQPSSPPPTPPPPPPAPPSQRPSGKVPPPCVPACVHGRCVAGGACECVRGWTDADCARPCELRDGAQEFDARGCPDLVNCTCSQPAPDGRTCLSGAKVNCEQAAVTSPGGGASGEGDWPKWLWWAVGGGVIVALLLFVVVPSAVALQRRHKNQRKTSHDRQTLQGKEPRSYTPGTGRAHHHDDQWQFMPS